LIKIQGRKVYGKKRVTKISKRETHRGMGRKEGDGSYGLKKKKGRGKFMQGR